MISDLFTTTKTGFVMKIYRALPLLILISGVLHGCSSYDETELIDYATLEELPVEVVMEIGESENYLPGRLRDLFVASDGTMLVSDWASITIEQFDAGGNYVGTVAGEGGGPGELGNFFSMINPGNDTLVVRQQSRDKIFYASTKSGLYKHIGSESANQNRERNFSILGIRPDGNWYATAGNIFSGIQLASGNEEDYRRVPLAVIDGAEKILQDSVQLLKKPLSHLTQSGQTILINSIPYRVNDRFRLLDDGRYLIARPDSSAFYIYNENHRLEKRISFPVKQRPVTNDDLDLAMEDVNSQVRGEIRNRVHDNKPPYLNIWATEKYLWLHTDNTADGKEFVIVDFEGNPTGKFMLSEHDSIQYARNGRLYTLHRNPKLGNSIRIYEVALP